MLHAVKKQISRAKQPIFSPPNAEFADYKQRLVSIKQSLKYTSVMLTSANRGWILQMQQQRLFSDRFYEAYPTTHDDVHAVAEQFANGSQKLYDKFTRENSEDLDTFRRIHHQVLVYIKEIEALEKTYGKLASAKAEATRYQEKLDSMERGRKPIDASKKDRNLQKMDRYKEQYKQLLQSIIENQKKTYAKHPIVFKAALTSYWLNHEKHVNMLVESLEATQQFARKHASEMKELDITTFEPDIAALIPTADSRIRNLSSKISSGSSSASEKVEDNHQTPVPAQTDNQVVMKPALPPISPLSQASPSSAGTSPANVVGTELPDDEFKDAASVIPASDTTDKETNLQPVAA